MLAVTVLIFLAGGPVALVVPALALLARRLRPSGSGRTAFGRFAAAPLPVLAAAGLIASGLLSAAQPFGDGLLGPFGWPAQVCALIALAAALMPAAPADPEPGPGNNAAAGQAAP